jgi:hypothetical protein
LKEVTELPLPDVELPDPAPETPRIPVRPISPLQALIASGILPKPSEAPNVSHEQLYWAVCAFDENVTTLIMGLNALQVEVAAVKSEVAHIGGMQTAESRALSDRLVEFNELHTDVKVLKQLAGLEADEKLERHHRESHPDRDTDRSPPPELDADERTTPGYRVSVPDVDGDPGP